MRDMGRRLNTIEKKLRLNRKVEILPPVITIGGSPTPKDEEALGPVETWITYREQREAQEEANTEHLEEHPGCVPKVIIIGLDADEEYRRRSERKCQTLTED